MSRLVTFANKDVRTEIRPDKPPEVVRIGPYEYIHVLDRNSNVTRLETGPQVFVRKENEKIVTAVLKYVTIPPRHYCTIRNPVVKEAVSKILSSLNYCQPFIVRVQIRQGCFASCVNFSYSANSF